MQIKNTAEDLTPVFSEKQFAEFSARLDAETKLAARWAAENKYATPNPPKIGCELECCLVGDAFLPAPLAAEFMRAFGGESAAYELGRFNIELNLPPLPLSGAAFSAMENALCRHMQQAAAAAQKTGAKIYAGGILPTLSPADFVSEMIVKNPRYEMLERQLRIMKKGRPFAVNLGYNDGVQFAANSAAIEAAATSFQAHLEIPESESGAFFNAAAAASAPVLAAGANAPFFMGRRLWAETRVPLFEQILFERFAGQKNPSGEKRRREDIFGARYLRGTAAELFSQNRANFPPLLPLAEDSPPEKMRHLALHNGTIWRWNRPVMGWTKNGNPALRIEHRPLPSGPTCADMAANMAFFVGLTYALQESFAAGDAPPFAKIRANFYAAARDGLDSVLSWRGKKGAARELLLAEFLPLAAGGLSRLSQLDLADGEKYLDIIRRRAKKNQNGAQWQVRYAAKHGGGTAGMARLAAAYWENQESNRPVAEWKI
ncbi:MAG: glutamate--cysteine ligase [Betaproteobacteria bacterium]|nr:glutamate--cysteine ligase [Betaproteobacteria bacterium]